VFIVVASFVFLFACQTFERRPDHRVQSLTARLQMRKDRRAHPRIPEFLDVIGRPRHRVEQRPIPPPKYSTL
jgi:hypothetical protein